MPSNQNSWKRWLVLSGIGLEMGAIIYLGHKLGQWASEALEIHSETPQILGTLLGVALSLYLVVQQTNKLNS
ncbi:MAG: AtpZ/AtpI family protein [Flavobacteriaceae bacterium]